jgi:hypothetical protein
MTPLAELPTGIEVLPVDLTVKIDTASRWLTARKVAPKPFGTFELVRALVTTRGLRSIQYGHRL